MKNESGDVIQNFEIREGLVSAFMPKYPDPDAKETLQEGIQRPEAATSIPRWNHRRGNIFIEDAECGG